MLLQSVYASTRPSARWTSSLYRPSSPWTHPTAQRINKLFPTSAQTAAQGHFLSTQPPPSSSNSSYGTPTSLNIRQRKSGTWLPRWQTVTLSRDKNSTSGTLQTSLDGSQPKNVPPNEDIDATKYLLSPQTAFAVFLPKGYPESVTSNYWPFAKWQFVHNVAGSVTAVISTQSLLFAMGLGAGSIPMAAALNWIIKDGLGQLGGVVYASFVSDKFDSEPKRFRFQATVAMQGANVLELLTPLWPGYFLIIASISNIGKNMAWLASSATRAQMNKTFALRDNLGDITGKSGSQTTAAGLVGTGLGVVIAALMNYVAEDPTVLPLIPMCLTFLPFSIFNIYSNYRSCYYVTTPSLNVPRAETVFNGVLENLALEKKRDSIENSTVTPLLQQLERLIPIPMEVAHKEVFVSPYISPFSIDIDIEPVVSRFARKGHGTEPLDRAFRQTDFVQREQYYIMVDESVFKAKRGGLCGGKVVIWFDKKAKGHDLIQGFYHACATRAILARRRDEIGAVSLDGNEWNEAVTMAHRQAIETVPQLIDVMNQKGWDTASLFLTDGDRNRIQIE
ncbi:vitamin B6 photo-protection and homoeostasis-domain-containing protein [Gamsiella multidivaricata]|uniref:vitamin B6 photo-protection and homoeostasis-domain-containing protein n=1 Tax=Gamsiella multidivaricata TaxID=101098 RepID=UPI002220226E|nr:vitamin B6 photo-protection and homoeostasis-domain-containing protein [Gamsiella multidivaricata]KAG0349876.1 hypothetical protein BGZ54_004142 [Gamsiella multidivaricata]KAI7825188.1 vitamin B6 photo-protection and homoeostasis-domain-containing protein [Gamsiella multidivaricata]